VPISAIVGMQMISHWGFLASVPFSILVVGGSWPILAELLNEGMDMNLPIFPMNRAVYAIGCMVSIILVTLVGTMSGVSMESREVQMRRRKESLANKVNNSKKEEK
jgi:hypothetical protein